MVLKTKYLKNTTNCAGLFFFRMLAQSYTPNIYTPTPILLLYNPFTIVLHKRLSAYLSVSSCAHTCLLNRNKSKQRLSPCYAAANREPGLLVAGAVSETWFALGVQAPNYIFVIREQYQTKPDICTSLILKKNLFLFLSCLTMG